MCRPDEGRVWARCPDLRLDSGGLPRRVRDGQTDVEGSALVVVRMDGGRQKRTSEHDVGLAHQVVDAFLVSDQEAAALADSERAGSLC